MTPSTWLASAGSKFISALCSRDFLIELKFLLDLMFKWPGAREIHILQRPSMLSE